MAIKAASGSAVEYYYALEDADGILQPSETTPDWTPIRFNTSGLAQETSQIDSNEINPDRQRVVSEPGTYSIAGTIEGELTAGTYDGLMAAALMSAWAAAPTPYTAATVDASDTDNSFNDAAATFVTDGFKAGDLITVSGFTTNPTENNVVDAKIVSLTETKIVVDATLVTEAAGDSVTITTAALGGTLVVGETEQRIAILERHTDVPADYLYRGCRVNIWSSALPIAQPVGITFAVIGESQEDFTVPGGSTWVAATTSKMKVTTSGYLQEDGVPLTFATDYNLSFDNQMNPLFALFSRSAYSVEIGVFVASGSLTTYFKDKTMYAKYLAGQEVNHLLRMEDSDGNWYRIWLPSVKYTQAEKSVGGQGAIQPSYTMSAGFDGNTTVRVERSA